MRAPSFARWMVLAVAGVAAIAYWDARRESAAAVEDFADEPVSLASAVASLRRDAEHDPLDPRDLAPLEEPGTRRVFIRRRGEPTFVTSEGTRLASGPLDQGFAEGKGDARLGRPEAAALGLPARSAIAGLRTFEWHGRPYEVAVVTSAARVRDREARTQWRLLLSVVLGGGLVLGFGVAALRRQKKELELERELAVAEIARARDEHLVRADKLATLGALSTGIAHEISTPLGVIVARADAIAGSEDPKTKRAAAIILEQSERITAVIRGFLGLARGSSPPLVHEAADGLATRAIGLTEHRFQEAGATVHASVEDEVPRVACDPLLFEHVLVNLLLNACDAVAPGGNVELRVEPRADRVAFVVRDDGPGISEEDAARAIEPFFTTKPEGKGTGLGLAIANEIVKHHNGRLSIGPGPGGRGTEAIVELPAVEESPHA